MKSTNRPIFVAVWITGALLLMSACTHMEYHSGAEQKAYLAAASSAAAEQRKYDALACPSYGAGGQTDVVEARVAMTLRIAEAEEKMKAASSAFVNMLTFYPGPRDIEPVTQQVNAAEDAIGGPVLLAALKWEAAVVQSLASTNIPVDPKNISNHPYWAGAKAYQADLAKLKRMAVLLDTSLSDAAAATGSEEKIFISKAFKNTPSQFSSPLQKVGERIDRCAAQYQPKAIAQAANVIEAHARTLRSSAEVERLSSSLTLTSSSAPEIAPIRASLASVVAEKKAAEAQIAAAERTRLQEEAQRQAQIAAAQQAQREAAAVEAAAKQAQADAQFRKNQAKWQTDYAARTPPRSYLCEGSGYTKTSVGQALSPDSRGSRSLVRFIARFTPDYKRMDIITSDGGFSAGRYPIEFISPTRVQFIFTRHVESFGTSADHDGAAQIDLSRGAEALTGFIEYPVPGLISQTYSISYEGFCNAQ